MVNRPRWEAPNIRAPGLHGNYNAKMEHSRGCFSPVRVLLLDQRSAPEPDISVSPITIYISYR